MLAELDALSAQTYVDPTQLALVHAALGDLDAAFNELARAVEVRAIYLAFSLGDSRFAALHQDPRFSAVMAPVARRLRPVAPTGGPQTPGA